MKKWKASGCDSITDEMIKANEREHPPALLKRLQNRWGEKMMPDDWKLEVAIKILIKYHYRLHELERPNINYTGAMMLLTGNLEINKLVFRGKVDFGATLRRSDISFNKIPNSDHDLH